MRRVYYLLILPILLLSCVPLRVAPNVEDYKVAKGNRFRKGLPKKKLFVFEDPKGEYHFYDYINTKFDLNDHYVDVEVPFQLDGKDYFFSFYEVHISDKAVNLLPLMFDATMNMVLGKEDFETYVATKANSIVNTGNYYIAIEVFSKKESDCLQDHYPNRKPILAYLRGLKEEYFVTHNYNEVVFKN